MGSSPTIRTMLKTMAEKFPLVSISDYLLCYARVAQLVEQRTFNPWAKGSNPFTGTIYADIPQLVEDALGKRAVASSILAISSKDSMYSNHYWLKRIFENIFLKWFNSTNRVLIVWASRRVGELQRTGYARRFI